MPERSVSLKIRQSPLSYVQQLDNRRTEDIKLVVVHCTELPDLAMARVYGEKVHYPDSQTGNSGHFYIKGVLCGNALKTTGVSRFLRTTADLFPICFL